MRLLSRLRCAVSPVAIVAVVASSIVTLLVLRAESLIHKAGARLEDQAPSKRASPPAPDPPLQTARVHESRADAILERNPFDSVTGRLEQGAAEVPRIAASICRDVELYRVILSDNSAWSFAELAAHREPALLHLKSAWNGRRVTAIDADRVRLEGKEGACTVVLHGKSGVSPAACTASDYRLGPPCIHRISDTEFDVAATMVDHVLESQAELMRATRVVPEQDEHGNVTGVRLFGIRAGSLMAALGFENGDALQTVNGFDVMNPERALEAYSHLRNASDLSVGLSRRGHNVVLTYHLI